MRPPDACSVVVEDLTGVVDALRSGASLREALLAAAERDGSSLSPVGSPLRRGRSLQRTLVAAARRSDVPEVSAALSVLAVHARAGGDPIRVLAALCDRLRERAEAARRARALTAQARLSARTILLLAPGFLLLLVALDPPGTWSAMTSGLGRVALGLGLVLQGIGAGWVSRIAGGGVPRRTEALRRVPVVRAVVALVAGRPSATDEAADVALTAEVFALVLEAGFAPSRALEVVAPTVPGAFGDGLRSAVALIRAGESFSEAVRAGLAGAEEAGRRFADVLRRGTGFGVPVAARLRELATDLRRVHAARLEEDVQRASVRILVPLGLVLLPAFVLTCLVPLFLGGLRGLSP